MTGATGGKQRNREKMSYRAVEWKVKMKEQGKARNEQDAKESK